MDAQQREEAISVVNGLNIPFKYEVKISDKDAIVESDTECVTANYKNVDDFNAGIRFVLDLLDNGWCLQQD